MTYRLLTEGALPAVSSAGGWRSPRNVPGHSRCELGGRLEVTGHPAACPDTHTKKEVITFRLFYYNQQQYLATFLLALEKTHNQMLKKKSAKCNS